MAGLLDGRVALVTGAASGMGRVMAKALAGAGAQIAGADLSRDNLASLAAELPGTLTIAFDVAQIADCKRAVDDTLARFGRLDILINCAGISLTPIAPAGHSGPLKLWEVTPEGWAKIHAINNVGAMAMAHYSVAPMLKQGWGRIINITTSFDTMLAGGFTPYGSSKSAIEASTAGWSKELADTGVTVNILVPGGPTDTPFLTEATRARAGLLKPEVMAVPVVWLASPQSDGITGMRFIARDWDESLSPGEAAERCRAPAGWPDLATAASSTRGRPSTG
jgi:NAD(P)-dependent dehydrogenase (short-subunit alcohol dehydrogenase family)